MDYIHGYSHQEQARLIQQAEYWRERLILRNLDYQPGESLLEIGCGAGAVLGILGQTYPKLKLAGIDLAEQQIAYAKHHLANLGLDDVELQVGDAANLPWSHNQFDRLYAIWFLEHLPSPLQVLREAQRVLKPGGTITITETDYRTILVTPESADYRYLMDSLCELLLQAQGNPYQGQSLGFLLDRAGFNQIKVEPFAVHHAYSLEPEQLRGFIKYVDSWLAPTVPQAATKLGKDLTRLETGLKWFRNISDRPDGAISATIYRAYATK